MELKGTVLNVVDFGAFVDIGLKDSGLVHISQLANRYVKSPHDVVSVGDVVTVWVMGVDQERKRVSLTMVKPGTERHRGPQGGGRRGGRAATAIRTGNARAADQGQGGVAAGGRGPRPPGSALTSPPVGAPSVAVLAEAPARRPDRDRAQAGTGGPGPAVPGTADAVGAGATGTHTAAAPGTGRSRRGRGGRIAGPAATGSPRSTGDRDRGAGPAPSGRPSPPGPPPPPLSKDALAGNVPLRTFGQLKQLWEARAEGPRPRRIGPARGSRSSPRMLRANTAPEPTDARAEPPESAHRRRSRRNPRRRCNRSNRLASDTTSGADASRCRSSPWVNSTRRL